MEKHDSQNAINLCDWRGSCHERKCRRGFRPHRTARPLHERRLVAPGRGYVWTPGYQRWDGRAYVWAPGAWVLPPRPRARWVPAHWAQRRGGWVFIEGHWR